MLGHSNLEVNVRAYVLRGVGVLLLRKPLDMGSLLLLVLTHHYDVCQEHLLKIYKEEYFKIGFLHIII